MFLLAETLIDICLLIPKVCHFLGKCGHDGWLGKFMKRTNEKQTDRLGLVPSDVPIYEKSCALSWPETSTRRTTSSMGMVCTTVSVPEAAIRNPWCFYPIRIGYAGTIYKFQGATLPHVTTWLDRPKTHVLLPMDHPRWSKVSNRCTCFV